MGASCTKPEAAPKPHEHLSIVVEQINIGSSMNIRVLKKTLRSNSQLLKKRIALYETQLKDIDPSDPRATTFIAEHARSTELLKTVCRMQAAMECMA